MRKHIVVAIVVVCMAAAAYADRKQAKKHLDAGLKHYKVKAWRDAIEAYQKALQEDPEWATAHYYLASAASIVGEVDLAANELRATAQAAQAGDEEALRLMTKIAPKDPDLDRITVRADVRQLLALPEYTTLTPEQRLTERKGNWSIESFSDECGAYAIATFTFKKGKVTGWVDAVCDPGDEGTPITKVKGTYTVAADGTVELKLKPYTSMLRMRWVECGGVANACLKAEWTEDGLPQEQSWHRGPVGEWR